MPEIHLIRLIGEKSWTGTHQPDILLNFVKFLESGDILYYILDYALYSSSLGGGGPTLFLSVDFVNILPKNGGGQTFMFTKALTKL